MNSKKSSEASPVTIEVLRELFAIGCRNLGLTQRDCLALTLLLQSREELGSMVKWMLKQEERGYKPDLTEVVLIAEKIKDYYIAHPEEME